VSLTLGLAGIGGGRGDGIQPGLGTTEGGNAAPSTLAHGRGRHARAPIATVSYAPPSPTHGVS
jgi:hypothetical protein